MAHHSVPAEDAQIGKAVKFQSGRLIQQSDETRKSSYIFEIRAEALRDDVIKHGDMCLEMSKSLMEVAVAEGELSGDFAWVARFLIECGQACYEAGRAARHE